MFLKIMVVGFWMMGNHVQIYDIVCGCRFAERQLTHHNAFTKWLVDLLTEIDDFRLSISTVIKRILSVIEVELVAPFKWEYIPNKDSYYIIRKVSSDEYAYKKFIYQCAIWSRSIDRLPRFRYIDLLSVHLYREVHW